MGGDDEPVREIDVPPGVIAESAVHGYAVVAVDFIEQALCLGIRADPFIASGEDDGWEKDEGKEDNEQSFHTRMCHPP